MQNLLGPHEKLHYVFKVHQETLFTLHKGCIFVVFEGSEVPKKFFLAQGSKSASVYWRNIHVFTTQLNFEVRSISLSKSSLNLENMSTLLVFRLWHSWHMVICNATLWENVYLLYNIFFPKCLILITWCHFKEINTQNNFFLQVWLIEHRANDSFDSFHPH